MHTAKPAHAPRGRHGFTLIEMMIAMTMLTIVGAAVVSVFNNQQRFVRSASDVGSIRTQMQTALAIVPTELRAVSPIDGDILAMSDSSIRVLSTIGSSIVCAFTASTVTLAPVRMDPADPLRLTSLAMPPMIGDSVFIWDEGASAAAGDDAWRSTAASAAYGVTAVNLSAGACPAPYTSVGNATANAYVLTIDAATPLRAASLVRGNALRITREVRFGLYKSAVDNQWYLGYRDPALANYQFVAGPFRSYAAAVTAPSGLRFQYWDTTDVEINVSGVNVTNRAVTSTVARMEITARAASLAPLSLGGGPGGKQFFDSLRVGMSFRNRNN